MRGGGGVQEKGSPHSGRPARRHPGNFGSVLTSVKHPRGHGALARRDESAQRGHPPGAGHPRLVPGPTRCRGADFYKAPTLAHNGSKEPACAGSTLPRDRRDWSHGPGPEVKGPVPVAGHGMGGRTAPVTTWPATAWPRVAVRPDRPSGSASPGPRPVGLATVPDRLAGRRGRPAPGGAACPVPTLEKAYGSPPRAAGAPLHHLRRALGQFLRGRSWRRKNLAVNAVFPGRRSRERRVAL